MESRHTTSKAVGWVLAVVTCLVGVFGVLLSLVAGFLVLYVAEMKPIARTKEALFIGLIFIVSVLCLVLARWQAKKLRSRR